MAVDTLAKPVLQVPDSGTELEATIQQVFEQQQAHSLALRSQPLAARKDKLKKLQRWMLDHQEDIQQALYADFQKPPAETDLSESFAVLTEIRHALNHLDQWARPEKVQTPLPLLGTKAWIQYEPKGVCLVIAPWNYPFQLALGPIISALAAGNTVILKPSEITPNTSALLNRLVKALFEPQEVAVFEGNKEVAQALLALPFDHIFFTGSPAVGKIVMAAAAKHLTDVTLELGGKSPAVLDRASDLKDAALKIAWGKWLNNGQTCVAPDYILLPESLLEAFLEHLEKAIKQLYNPEGKGIEQSPDYARMVNQNHYNRVVGLLQDGMEQGGTVAIGGQTNDKTLFIAPTVVTGLPAGSALLEEEVFGPVLPIVTYSSFEEAIATINSKPKPLALYAFTGQKEHTQSLQYRTSAGGMCIHDAVIHFLHNNLPFGGVNNSGLGKGHGHEGFKAFSNAKGVLKQRRGWTSTKLLYPPYTGFKKKVIKLLMKYF